MMLRKSVQRAFSMAVFGVAFSGAAIGQVAAPGTATGNADTDAQVDTNIQADADVQADTDAAAAPAPPVDSPPSEAINADGSVDTSSDAQVDRNQTDVDGAARTNRQNRNSDVRSNTDSNLDSQENRGDISSTANERSGRDRFGATFDSQVSDRLVIQDLEPNSTAARLGLQAGDRIISINGQSYTDVDQFESGLMQLDVNADVPITYERNGRRYTQRFRMSAMNGQSSYYGQNYGNQGWGGQFGQASHSVNRPMYGDSYQGPNGNGVAVGNGCGIPVVNSDCCGGFVPVQECYDGHHHHRRHRHGRHHRNYCR